MLTETNATVLQKVAEVVKHRALVLATDAAEVAQETTAVGHHAREPDLLQMDKLYYWPFELILHLENLINVSCIIIYDYYLPLTPSLSTTVTKLTYCIRVIHLCVIIIVSFLTHLSIFFGNVW